MDQQELNQLMQESATDAVHSAQEMFGITLSFDAASIALVDEVLIRVVQTYNDKALQDSAVFTLCNIYGAYIGEVFKTLAGGQWRYDQSEPDAPFVVLDVGDRSYAFAGICYERLVNDTTISVRAYFDLALENQKQ
ncbi:hypothetical protein [Salinimonas lutimaris]|uniref:hypothetical protein n=1 Tax=Salinimonas lutimaris TaxID=914153 RepID=UPI0010C08F4B|nr:hypothetical protein [Salinimonas lutimaris]